MVTKRTKPVPIAELDLHYVHSDEFLEPGARRWILGPEPPGNPAGRRPASELDPYLASLYEVPLLPRELEVFLFRQMNFLLYETSLLRRNGAWAWAVRLWHDQAEVVRNRIIKANLRLVVSVVKKWVTPHASLHELISDGNMGLRRAVRGFGYSQGFKFSTYATTAITRFVSRAWSVTTRDGARFSTGHDGDLFLTCGDRDPPAPREAQYRENVKQVAELLGLLTPQCRLVIEYRFGLNGRERLLLREVGERLGLSKERARQIEAAAMATLRAAAVA